MISLVHEHRQRNAKMATSSTGNIQFRYNLLCILSHFAYMFKLSDERFICGSLKCQANKFIFETVIIIEIVWMFSNSYSFGESIQFMFSGIRNELCVFLVWYNIFIGFALNFTLFRLEPQLVEFPCQIMKLKESWEFQFPNIYISISNSLYNSNFLSSICNPQSSSYWSFTYDVSELAVWGMETKQIFRYVWRLRKRWSVTIRSYFK